MHSSIPPLRVPIPVPLSPTFRTSFCIYPRQRGFFSVSASLSATPDIFCIAGFYGSFNDVGLVGWLDWLGERVFLFRVDLDFCF